MNKYRLSRLAASDLEEIAEYTIEYFGIEQARHYRDGLKECFIQLANNPEIGRKAEQLTLGLRRFSPDDGCHHHRSINNSRKLNTRLEATGNEGKLFTYINCHSG